MKKVLTLLKDEQGQSMVEYGILVAIIAVGAIAVLTSLRGQIAKTFNDVVNALGGGGGGTPGGGTPPADTGGGAPAGGGGTP